jgi:predicted aspartyl protease
VALKRRRVESTRFPYLPLSLDVRGQVLDSLEALVDTGFDGGVALPEGRIHQGGVPDGYVYWSLADGSQIRAQAYRGQAQIGDLGIVHVVVTIVGDEPLVGRMLTGHFTLILHHGKRLIVEP